MHNFRDRYQEVQADFETPEAATKISGRTVNLSAWFDVPPDSLLQHLIWYFDNDDNTDNTLGDLFPDVPDTPLALSPDFNGDGNVGFPDFILFAQRFGTQKDQSEYEARFDLNEDGLVGFSDFIIFASAFGTSS